MFKKNNRIFLFLAVVVLIIGAAFYFSEKDVQVVRASAGDNVSGFAWNSNIGWISFDSTNETPPPPADYGVKIDNTSGDFSGYAWSSNIGWISFNRSNTGNPPSPDPGSGSGAIANYDSNTNKVIGWAKILSMGPDGWVRFDQSGLIYNGVSIDPATSAVSGWAWNGNDNNSGIGWISFSSANEIPPSASYGVTADVNTPPTVPFHIANIPNYCDAQPMAEFDWTFFDVQDGATQTKYDIIIYSGGNEIINLSNQTGAPGHDYNIVDADYGKTLTWKIKVYDSQGLDSGWVSGDNFDVATNKAPQVSFTWYAPDPSVEESILFTADTTCYTGSTPSVNCLAPSYNWSWTTSVVGDSIVTGTASTTIINFASDGADTIYLNITDTATNVTCGTSTVIGVQKRLPEWIEG